MDKNITPCSDFEEMLMWTAYRYCIGRHSYVTTLAYDIGKNYYNRLSDEKKKFTASDIRSEIYTHIRFLPFDFKLHRWYNTDEYNPLKVLFKFFEKENVNSIEDLATFSRVEYDVHKDEFIFNKCEPNFKSYISQWDINDLVPWETLASLFDIENHKILVLNDGSEVEAFKTWTVKSTPIGPNCCKYNDFGWEEIWKSVDDFINKGEYYYVPNKLIKEIKDL